MTMMNRAQSALPHPDNSWSRKMSAKIEMSSQIQANSSMNQKIDRMMSQKFMTGSRLEGRGGRSLRIISIAEAGPGPLTLKGRSLRLPPAADLAPAPPDGTVREAVQLVRHAERSSGLIIITETI